MAKTGTAPINKFSDKTPAKSVQHAADVARDGWNTNGNKDCAGALANDKAKIRKPCKV